MKNDANYVILKSGIDFTNPNRKYTKTKTNPQKVTPNHYRGGGGGGGHISISLTGAGMLVCKRISNTTKMDFDDSSPC